MFIIGLFLKKIYLKLIILKSRPPKTNAHFHKASRSIVVWRELRISE